MIKNLLTDNEEILWKSREGKNYRMIILLGQAIVVLAILGILFIGLAKMEWISKGKYLLLAIFLIGIIFIAIKQLLLLANLYLVTTERVIIKRGLISRKLTSIRLENILDTRAEQSFWERIIQCGSVYFYTANNSQDSKDFTERIPEFQHINHPLQEHSNISKIHKKYKDE